MYAILKSDGNYVGREVKYHRISISKAIEKINESKRDMRDYCSEILITAADGAQVIITKKNLNKAGGLTKKAEAFVKDFLMAHRIYKEAAGISA